jgi:topoisomerase IV subunit A
VLLAAVNSDGRLLVFPVADLPELPRGKGNKIFGIPSKKAATGEERLVAIAAVAPGQSLRILSGERHMGLTCRELGEYRGERGQRGAVLPRGWRKVDGLEADGG